MRKTEFWIIKFESEEANSHMGPRADDFTMHTIQNHPPKQRENRKKSANQESSMLGFQVKHKQQ